MDNKLQVWIPAIKEFGNVISINYKTNKVRFTLSENNSLVLVEDLKNVNLIINKKEDF